MLSLSSPAPLDTSWLLRSGCAAAGGAVCIWAMSWPALGKTCRTFRSDIRLLKHACLTLWPGMYPPDHWPWMEPSWLIPGHALWHKVVRLLSLEPKHHEILCLLISYFNLSLKALNTFIHPEISASVSGAEAKIPLIRYKRMIVLIETYG